MYKIKQRLENAVKRLGENQRVSDEAREALRKFVDDLASQGISLYRQAFYITHLVPLAEDLGAAFISPTKEDVKSFVAKVERSDLAEWTKANKRVAIKRFYKWLLGNDEEYPHAVKWIKTSMPNNKTKLPEDLLTREEIRALIDAAISNRDKALISILADGGIRIGEALSLRVKDFHPDRYGGFIEVTGKTGPRHVRLLNSVPRLSAWLEDHPAREDGEAPIFIQLGRDRGEPLKYAAARKAIREAAKRAGIKKPVNPHAFRHARATILAKRVPEAPLEGHMGWVHGSKMAKTYVHLSGRDLDETVLGSSGIEIREEGAEEEVPTKCPRCDTWNDAGKKLCRKCHMALDEAEAIAREEDLKKLEGRIGDLEGMMIDFISRPARQALRAVDEVLKKTPRD